MKSLLCALAAAGLAFSISAAEKNIVFLAGPPSHGPGDHEHRAGCLLLKHCLDQACEMRSVVYSNGWPAEGEAALANAAAIVIYSDGGGGHPFLQDDRMQVIGKLMKQGVGLVCLHYAVEPTPDTERQFIDWLGGCFAINWSVNPDWKPDFKSLPVHPVTRGVQPFSINDEWYFHMRFRDAMKGVTPILTAVPPESTMRRSDGPHEGNPAVREAVKRGEPQAVAWVFEREDGGRAFGFTGGHYHKNWGDDNVRKLVLNAILWTAHETVPEGGAESAVSSQELKANLDRK